MNRAAVLGILLLMGGCSTPAASEAWQRTKLHVALKGENPEHAKAVIRQCRTDARLVVETPEAFVPPAYEMWGLRFGEGATEAQKKCVLDQVRVTKGEYFSAAEAASE